MTAESGCNVDMRELKALEIAARSRITCANGVWSVPSQSGNGTYRVTISPDASCTCDDFALIGATGRGCKHVIAARLVQERDGGGTAPKIVTDAVPKKPTYKQAWPQYNAAKQEEGHHFPELLADLCSSIPEPPLKGGGRGGRIPVPLGDRIFAAVYRTFKGTSTRRFMSDLTDAHRDGFISEMMSFNVPSITMQGEDVTAILLQLIRRSSLPLRAVDTSFAVDSTGFAFNKWTKWLDIKYGTPRKACEWVKVHVCVGTQTNVVTAAFIGDKHAADCPQFDDLVRKTAEDFAVMECSGDKAYLSADNLKLVEELGGKPYIPFKSNSCINGNPLWDRMYYYFMMKREEFLSRYHQRSNVESTFSGVKRVFGDSVRAKTERAAINEVLAKILAWNLTCVIGSWYELGIDPTDWKPAGAKRAAEGERGGATILPMRRPG